MNQADVPPPWVEAEFHTEPHPDPTVRALIEEVERLRQENQRLKEELHGADTRKCHDHRNDGS